MYTHITHTHHITHTYITPQYTYIHSPKKINPHNIFAGLDLHVVAYFYAGRGRLRLQNLTQLRRNPDCIAGKMSKIL
jgi:hypothetical protein